MSTPDATPGTPGTQDTPATAGRAHPHSALDGATHRLVRSVDALDDASYGAPSLLPGWTRGHVVAHLALNAEALAAALRGVVDGEPVAMYASPEARDLDIEALAAATPSTLRSRLYAATTGFADALAALAAAPADRLDVAVERTPGSERTFTAGEVASMRLHEVEIHHVDLGADDRPYRPTDWPLAFAVVVVDRFAPRVAATLVATDTDRTWQAESHAPTVTGTAADLGWWLTGRDGDRLTTDGVMPRIEAW